MEIPLQKYDYNTERHSGYLQEAFTELKHKIDLAAFTEKPSSSLVIFVVKFQVLIPRSQIVRRQMTKTKKKRETRTVCFLGSPLLHKHDADLRRQVSVKNV